jgi:hypothetical protein
MVVGTGDCEECGNGDAEMRADGRWLCANCAAEADAHPVAAALPNGGSPIEAVLERRTVDRRGGDRRTGDRRSGDRRAADRRTADRRAAGRRSADHPAGRAAERPALRVVDLGVDDRSEFVDPDSLSLVGLLLPSPADDPPEVVIGDESWTWAELGAAIGETMLAGRAVELHLEAAAADTREGAGALGRPRLPDDDGVRAEAVALLADCLARTPRHSCPPEALSAAAARIRKGLDSDEAPWKLIAAGAGWGGRTPSEDEDLWLEAALCLAAPRWRLPLTAEAVGCLASMELDDWIATVIELTRAGPGTPVDPQSLLVLAARCMDVDSGAVEPQSAARMRMAFEVVVPVWRAVGAIGNDGLLTLLGAWGLPRALAWAWGGSLDDA